MLRTTWFVIVLLGLLTALGMFLFFTSSGNDPTTKLAGIFAVIAVDAAILMPLAQIWIGRQQSGPEQEWEKTPNIVVVGGRDGAVRIRSSAAGLAIDIGAGSTAGGIVVDEGGELPTLEHRTFR